MSFFQKLNGTVGYYVVKPSMAVASASTIKTARDSPVGNVTVSSSYSCYLEQEREQLFSNAIEAVKQCQTTFGGKSQLAADTDTTVSILLMRLERIFHHGLKQKLTKAVIDGAFRQITEFSGFNLNHMKPDLATDIVFWNFVKNFLNKDELLRFAALKNVKTDYARGRAWIRECLNEHNLDKYLLMILADSSMIKQYYDPHAFFLDTEKTTTMTEAISSLHNIYFALKIDNSDLEFGRAVVADSNGAPLNVDPLEGEMLPIVKPDLSRSDSDSISSRSKRKRHKKRLARIEELSKNLPVSSGSGIKIQNTRDEVFHQLGSSNQQHGAPDLIPLFEKFDINHPIRDKCSSQNSESSNQEGSFVTGQSEEIVNELELSNSGSLDANATIGGVNHDFLQSESSVSSSSKHGHHRSYSDNTKKLQSIKAELNQTVTVSGSPGSANAGLSIGEMKQAALDMMKRKDEFERQNNLLQDSLRQEKLYSESLQKVVEESKSELETVKQRAEEREVSLKREVDLLKSQLKRYISAVNTLKNDRKQLSKSGSPVEGSENSPAELDVSPLDGIDVEPSSPDGSDEATSYEAKLVAMSGLHAELLELNEQLQNDLLAKDRTIHHLRNEINVLRGPLPGNEFLTVEDLAAMFVNIWIPSSFLRQNHHIYQISIRIKNEEWKVFKRYQQFYDFHNSLKKEYPIVENFELPPKKTVGNKDAKFIEERKRGLQTYLQKTTNYLVRQHSRIRSQLSKDVLINFLPFFSPVHNAFTVNR